MKTRADCCCITSASAHEILLCPLHAAAGEKAQALREQMWKAHVPVTNEQHDPANGLISGFCERCRLPWPCAWSPEFLLARVRPVERSRLEDSADRRDDGVRPTIGGEA